MDEIYLLINGYTKEVVCAYTDIEGKEAQILDDVNEDMSKENRGGMKTEKIELNAEGEWRINIVSNGEEEDVSYYLLLKTELKKL